MSVQSKIAQWRHVGRFFAQRVSDYGELFRIELAETKSRLLHEVVALVALAVCTLFTLSFLCIAIIASAIGTPYFLAVVWGVAGIWAIVTVAAFSSCARGTRLSRSRPSNRNFSAICRLSRRQRNEPATSAP